MEHNTSSVPGRRTQTVGPAPKEGEKSVHIIFVPEQEVLNELHQTSLGNGPMPAATLAQVVKHIGHPAPTDIVVFAKRPWHFAGRPGQPKELHAHPQVHRDFPETVLVLGKNEQAVWWSEKAFTVTGVVPSGDQSHSHPGFEEATNTPPQWPFNGPDPLITRVEPHNNNDLFVARSGVPKADAAKHMYKVSFEIENRSIDPDVYCGGN
jgi:hypothetical protein